MEDYENEYKEALERAKIELNADTTQGTKNVLMTVFPELKESEDDKIRKAIIDFLWKEKIFLQEAHSSVENNPKYRFVMDAIAWLEKQGSNSIKWQKNTPDNKPTLNHSVLMKTTQGIAEGEWQGEHWFQYRWSCRLKDSEILYWIELHDLDEQDEQKPILDFKASNWYVSKVDGKIHDMTYNPTDKVEPKFKVGDWIVDNHGIVNQVTSTTDDGYGLALYDGTYVSGCWKDYYHLWTIQDAKDGDVLVDEDNNIGIYKEIEGLCWHSYIYLGCDNHLRGFSIGGSHIKNNTKPATKEQRDLLFQTMKEKGYEWDADKKKLKKINSYCQENCKGYQETGKCFADGGCDAKRKAEQKSEPAWSEEDENLSYWTIQNLTELKNRFGENYGNCNKCINWFKSLKDRIGG